MPDDSVTFDRAADYYDETRGFPPGEEKNAAALICRAGNLTSASRVLEVGVGTGRIALPLAPCVRAVFGVDLSRPMMARLQARRSGEAVHPVQAGATQLPFPGGVFDAAVAVHVFHLIPAWRDAVRELARVLRPGGLLLTGYSGTGFRVLREAFIAALPPEHRGSVGVGTEEFAAFLTGEGWQPTGGPFTHRYTYHRSPGEYVDLLRRRVWSRTWRLTDEELEQGIAAVQAAIARHYGDPRRPAHLAAEFRLWAYRPPSPTSSV